MTAQDPELSAALGWPGGISDPVLDRKVLLQMVATMRLASQQALEVLKFCTPKPRPTDDDYAEQGWKEHYAAIASLRAALAQQAEPRNQCRSDGRCQYAIDHGGEGMGHCPKGKCVMAQHTQPAEDRDVAQSNLILMKEMFREQAEPVQEPVACSNTFACQCSKHFASQQSEQRPKRVLTAVWRDRAQRAEAQRDALLEALKAAEPYLRHADVDYNVYVQCRAVIKAVEVEKNHG